MHEPLRQRIAVQYHLEGLSREDLDAYLAHQFKAAGVTQPLFDDTARQALYQATKGILRKVSKLALTALRLAAARKASLVGEAILLDATAEALLSLSLAAGADRIGFPSPAPRRVLVCQFELPVAQFVSRLPIMRRALGAAADQRLLVDTRAAGHLLSAAQG